MCERIVIYCEKNYTKSNTFFATIQGEQHFLGANAPLGPGSSEGLYVCMYVCNTLAPYPLPPAHLSYKIIQMNIQPEFSKI